MLNQDVDLERDVVATRIPVGEEITLEEGTEVTIMQMLGGSFTVITPFGMARIEAKDADALGIEVEEEEETSDLDAEGKPKSLEERVWDRLKTVYDPEIPVNIVDLGLVYTMKLWKDDKERKCVEVKMTLTAPGCGMGPTIQADAQSKVLSIEEIFEAKVDLVWEPAWDQSMISEVGKMKLGLI